MTLVEPVLGLAGIVAAVLIASRWPVLAPLFRWMPTPLWCYLLPVAAVTIGWLPRGDPTVSAVTRGLLPIALGLLLLDADVPAMWRVGPGALAAMAVGAVGIAVGALGSSWLLSSHLPPEAWKGAGALAATWTGGTLNLLALRALLNIPDTVFAPLIIVDALLAYSWMALLVAASGFQESINAWLKADAVRPEPADQHRRSAAESRGGPASLAAASLLAIGLALGAHRFAASLPTSPLVSSATGWMVLLVTTGALGLSCIPAVRRVGARGSALGYPCLYLVLAATGAQANLQALGSTPVWIVLGVGVVLVHGVLLLAAGRLMKIPLGLLATASQANVGGFVSAPMVGAVYEPSLAAVGLVLAMAGNALGTYCGLLVAWLTHRLVGG